MILVCACNSRFIYGKWFKPRGARTGISLVWPLQYNASFSVSHYCSSKGSFRMSLASNGSSSSLYSLGTFTLLLNLEGIHQYHKCKIRPYRSKIKSKTSWRDFWLCSKSIWQKVFINIEYCKNNRFWFDYFCTYTRRRCTSRNRTWNPIEDNKENAKSETKSPKVKTLSEEEPSITTVSKEELSERSAEVHMVIPQNPSACVSL